MSPLIVQVLQVTCGSKPPESIAAREASVRKVNMSISLAFLARALSKQQSKPAAA